MNIAILYLNNPPFGPDTHANVGLGGSENGVIRTIEYLIRYGHHVDVFNRVESPPIDYGNNLVWSNLNYFNPRKPYDVIYSLRHKEVFDERPNAKLKVLFLADTESIGLGDYVRDGRIDLVMGVSHWQSNKIASDEKIPSDAMMVTSNGVVPVVQPTAIRVPKRCLYMATPDRLGCLLEVWPRINAAVPEAELHAFCSFMGWGTSAQQNEAELSSLYAKMATLPGLVNCRHGNADQIRREQQEAELYLYPSDFPETCCMSVVESMLNGCVPIVTGKAALLEKVVHGVTGFVVPAYATNTRRYQDMFVDLTVSVLTQPKAMQLDKIAENGRLCASYYTYDYLVPKWVAEWERRIQEKGL